MAVKDTEYIEAPSLRAGNLHIDKSSSGFIMSAGNTTFLTGATDGTLTIGKEGLASSIPALNINAKQIYWNGQTLESYWSDSTAEIGNISQALGTLQTKVDTQNAALQAKIDAQNTAIQTLDSNLSSEIDSLRLNALGAGVDILNKSTNGFVSDICGIAVPVSLLRSKLPHFNKVIIRGIRKPIEGYLAIYASNAVTPELTSSYRILHIEPNAYSARGSQTAPVTCEIRLSEEVAIPETGTILLTFAVSTAVPAEYNINWIIDGTLDEDYRGIQLLCYSPGNISTPEATNGVWLLQKKTAAQFISYSVDAEFIYTGHAEDDELHLTADLKSQIKGLLTDNYMTYEETFEAINNFPGVTEGYECMLGTLVDQLANIYTGFTLTKQNASYGENGPSTNVRIGPSGVNVLMRGTVANASAIQDKAYLGLTDDKGFQVSYYYKSSQSDSALAQLALDSGHLELGLQRNPDAGGFELLAKTLTSSNSSSYGMHMEYYSPKNTNRTSYLEMNGSTTYVGVTDSSGYVEMQADASQIRLLKFSGDTGNRNELKLDHEGLKLSLPGRDWDPLVNAYSSCIPTISVVYAMIQDALANQ